MSRENVEIVQRFFDAMNRGDYAAAEMIAHPEIAMQDHPAMPDAGWNHGREGAVRWWSKINEAFANFRFEDIEMLPVGRNSVVGTLTVSGEGGQSGVPITMPVAFVATIENGMGKRVAVFATATEASRAAADLLDATELRE